ncbi:hypothetical protein GOP80_06075 [Planococcaceae bacterium Storch 2/2-2]|nr:hypothetical protein [Planococcaceae bacterium Storch 2/2-2]
MNSTSYDKYVALFLTLIILVVGLLVLSMVNLKDHRAPVDVTGQWIEHIYQAKVIDSEVEADLYYFYFMKDEQSYVVTVDRRTSTIVELKKDEET